MTRGIGNDILEIERIRKSIERYGSHFLDRVFTRNEQAYCNKFKDSELHFAGKFSAKEAVAKSLGLGFGSDLFWHDIEILNDDQGKPHVYFSEKILKRLTNPKVHVAISHSSHYTNAVAIWE